MIGQELTQHLQHIGEQLATLLKSYQDFKFRNNKQEQQNISLSSHILYVAAIIIIIISATYALSSFILEARKHIMYIAGIQALLSIGFYMFFVKKVTKDKEQQAQPKENSNKTIYELDQLRFEILQELATSPVPQNYITPTAIKRMQQLLESGLCTTLDECTARFDKETKKQTHVEELELIKYLQTISYH